MSRRWAKTPTLNQQIAALSKEIRVLERRRAQLIKAKQKKCHHVYDPGEPCMKCWGDEPHDVCEPFACLKCGAEKK